MIDDSVRCSSAKLRLGGFRTIPSVIARSMSEYRHATCRYSNRMKLFPAGVSFEADAGERGRGVAGVLLADLCKYGGCAADSGFVPGGRRIGPRESPESSGLGNGVKLTFAGRQPIEGASEPVCHMFWFSIA
jgi:hypothetical protein